MHNLSERLQSLYELLESFRQSPGEESSCLIAVSKNQSLEQIRALADLGHCNFAENRLQEAQKKIPQLALPQLQWHFIGHLQSKKLKRIAELFHYVHSLSEIPKAQALNTHCQTLKKRMKVFIQVNSSQEAQKSGLTAQELGPFLKEVNQYPHLEILGLMTLAAFCEDEARIRQTFSDLRALRDTWRRYYPSLQYLSMGMSGDYSLALGEGATHIRLGRALFEAF